MEQGKLFAGKAEQPHKLSRGHKLGMLDRMVLPKVRGASAGSLLHMLRVIDSFAGNYRRTLPIKRETLAARARVSVRQAQRLINALAELGLVFVEHTSGHDGHRTASRYRPLWESIAKLVPETASAGVAEASGDEGQSATVALRRGEPECHGVQPECHGVQPECHGGTAIPSIDPLIDPPPPKSPVNRLAKAEGAGAEKFFLDPDDVRDLRSLVRAFRRVVDDRQNELERDAGSLSDFLTLVQATDREARARAGTEGQFFDWVGVLNARLKRPRVQWRGWATPSERDNGHRQAALVIRQAGANWERFASASIQKAGDAQEATEATETGGDRA